ncbi:MAG: type II secretion system F family protein [Microbacteriaceae bacterium]
MNPTLVLALFVILLLGAIGAWIVVSALLPKRSLLLERVALQISDLNEDAAALSERVKYPPFALVTEALVRSLKLESFNALSIGRMQAKLGVRVNPTAFLYRQLRYALIGLASAIFLLIFSEQLQAQNGIVHFLLLLSSAISGWMLPMVLLNSGLKRRERRIAQELPTVLEFLTLSLSAGEGIADAIRRVSHLGQGVIAIEFQRIVSLHSSGIALKRALQLSSAEIAVPDYARFIHQLCAAMERGNPLLNILRAQSEDSTEKARKELIEQAGRKEIAMMVPLVFLILPVVVLFAIYPGILALQLGG